jgi:uncharacterized protein YyaL (SSP411 family)
MPRASNRSPNRLARETSPYLLQHAHNPVDWFPWGPEAFAAARARDVPIFLSVGYSTCYWCHVMERESFENDQIAALLNSHFVCIKVDREERPDVDDIYMTATQAMTNSGGWPMNVFLEPTSLKPFWCGTYFPPEARWGRPGFPELILGIADAWKKQRDDVTLQSSELAEAVRERLADRASPVRLSERQVAQGVGQLLKLFDRVNAGFGEAPKFPQPVYLELLLRFRAHAGDEETAAAVDEVLRSTLDRMALGGINDQLAGGFHRYSVDEKWIVPHFEKMLYDNAQLAGLYADAARVFSDAFYRRTAERTLDYALREMVSSEGAFASAQDAEVNHREGQNYLWTLQQVREVLPPEDAHFIARVYALDGAPNFRDPHHPDDAPANVLWMRDRPERVAQSLGMETPAFLERLDRLNAALLAARARRDQPARDDKVLAAWNALMISALARAGLALDRPDYTAAATRAAEMLLARMRDAALGLLRSYRPPSAPAETRIPAFFEDYAFLVQALAHLHRADPGGPHLRRALDLLAEAEARFADPATGAYFDTRADQPDLFVRASSQYDGAIPCGASVMANALLDLAASTSDPSHARRAARCLATMSRFIASSPVAAANSTRALLRLLTEHPAVLAEAFEHAPDAPDARQRAETQPVSVYAAVERVGVTSTAPGTLLLQLRVADGYHVNAAEPGVPGLVGFRVEVINATGLDAYAQYPEGDAYTPAWSPDADPVRVYQGVVEIPVLIEKTGPVKGTPLLAVTYQACTDTECLAPSALELSVSIDVVE